MKRMAFIAGALMAQRSPPAIKRSGLFEENGFKRRDCNSVSRIRLAGVNLEGLVANSHSLPALQGVAIVINHLAPGTAVNDGLLAFPARSLLALMSNDCDRTEVLAVGGGLLLNLV